MLDHAHLIEMMMRGVNASAIAEYDDEIVQFWSDQSGKDFLWINMALADGTTVEIRLHIGLISIDKEEDR